MLMAAALLISTNAGAQYVAQIGNTGYASLQDAVNAVPAGGTATIELLEDITLSAPVVIPQVKTAATDAEKVVNREMQHITLNLAGNNIASAGSYTGSAIILLKGELNITGIGTISRNDATSNSWKGSWDNFSAATILVCGADGNKNDATKDLSKQEWSILTIGEKVVVEGYGKSSDSKKGGYGIGIQNFNASSFPASLDAYVYKANLGYQTYYTTTDNPLWWGGSSSGAAFGVKVIIAGKVKAHQRGINIVGTINQSAKEVEGATARKYTAYPYYDHYYPYIKIEKTATVECVKDGLTSGNGGIYGGGWAVIDILGTVKGQTGVFLKGGDLVVNGGTVQSTSESGTAGTDANYGGEVSGNAIFIGSASNYAGATNVSVEGGATIEAGEAGAAIVDKVATNIASEATVEHVTIKDGTLDGGLAVTTATGDHTTIINATIDGDFEIVEYNAQGEKTGSTVIDSPSEMEQFLPNNATATGDEPDYSVTSPEEGTIKVEPNTAKLVTLNAYGLATYSFVNADGKTRELPSGVKAYVATGALDEGGEVLKLTQVTNGNIPQGVGVILYGEDMENAEITLPLSTGDAATIAENTNKLVAASAWTTQPAVSGIYTATTEEMQAKASLTLYVLVGNELYKYTGNQMKVNKAYLQLPAQNNAPKRIQMVFNETQAVENVETTIEAVKFMENGQIYIRRGENIYNVQGQIVK